jgi:hypothetical protein
VSANGTGFTSGNPNAPEGTQVAFLQGEGSFSQTVAGLQAGVYQISFMAAQRVNVQASEQDFDVLVDGSLIYGCTPVGPVYADYTTVTFALMAGEHTITFQGKNLNGGDNTVFIDSISLTRVPPAPPIVDAGFEVPVVGPAGVDSSFQYRPSGSAWTFAGGAGVSANGTGFTSGNSAAPEGAQVAFLQGTGSFEQVINSWETGFYRISFKAAQRGNFQSSNQDFWILVDGGVLGYFSPNGTSYADYTTVTFAVTAGAHRITFQGLNSRGGDNTAFIDDVTLTRIARNPRIGNMGFEVPTVGPEGDYYSFQYRPSGAEWGFVGAAGVSANGSGFTSGNPDAPEGSQVAFLQQTGKFGQRIDGWETGLYQITFKAAQRNYNGVNQEEIGVVVDGVTVGSFTPTGTSYTDFTTMTFAVTAGSHQVNFEGFAPSGKDYTALIDDIRVTRVL